MNRGPCGLPVNRTASAHFIGGMPIAESAAKGVVDPYQRAFGYPGLHVMDGSVMPANPGVNPSLMITGLAERAMSLWPNKGDADPRPALGSGYNRQKPIMPRKPIVPKGARLSCGSPPGRRTSFRSIRTDTAMCKIELPRGKLTGYQKSAIRIPGHYPRMF